jgi:hypothetical protein
MSLSQVRDTYSWQGAIELGRLLAALADELPAAEDNGLARGLRKGMVELPATIAADVLASHDDKPARMLPVLRLIAAIDLIDRVYPALDTADAREALEKLFDRLSGPDFDERKNPPRPKPAAPEVKPEPPHPAPETVPVIPEAAPAPAPLPAVHHAEPHSADHDTNPALKVAVNSDGDDHQRR